MTQVLQLFDALPKPIEDALRESIRRFGVLVPVMKDQHGRILDGHHRARIADEEGTDYRVDIRIVADDDEARELARTLNSDRRQLTPEQRQEVVVALRQAGHSYRAIAGALGVSEATAHRDAASTVTDVTVPDRTVGLDGKSRPARRSGTIAARNRKEADRAAAALDKVDGQLPIGSVVDVKTAERMARKVESDRLRESDIDTAGLPPVVDIRHGDFMQVLADLPDQSVDVILTDPPYPGEFLPLWSDLGAFARRVLRPSGLLVAMSGQTHLPEVMRRLCEHLDYRWTMAYLTPGASYQSQARNVASQWKPVLVFGANDHRLFDVAKSEGDDKEHHFWGQSESGMASLIRLVAEPGQLICDPFVGGGTTAVVAVDFGCSFVGAELDLAEYARAIERMSA